MLKHVLAIVLFVTSCLKAQTVNVNNAAAFEGKTVTICAKVVETHVSKGENKVVYLNLDKPYPNQPFTVVIFEKSADNFDYNPLEFLKNKTICITGKVSIYKNKPQIIANKQEQIKIQN